MNFSKVKLVSGGQHGLIAEYIEAELKNGFQFDNTHTHTRKLPVPKPLCDEFKKLEAHVQLICTFAKTADIEITGVSSNASDQFIVMAKVRTFDNSIFAVNTPLIKSETEYGMFDEVIAIIKGIYVLANDYFEKKQSASSRQIALDLFNADPEKVNDVINADVEDGEARRVITAEDIDTMAEGDLRPLLIAALERKGCLVMEEEASKPAEEKVSKADDGQSPKETKKMKVA